jgi:hypothetical protein
MARRNIIDIDMVISFAHRHPECWPTHARMAARAI